MKKLLLLTAILTLIIFNSCDKTCNDEHTGNLIIYDVSPDWIQEVNMNITWADGTSINIMIDGEDAYYQKPVGLTIIEMTYKSDSCIYYSSGYVNIVECQTIPIFCNFD